ncbi:Ca2+-transporting ATPase [Pedobacter sp. CG_S7]|uniref:cation-translocating P-type ATPase n=1 Tax=Pedobacter sp. CG_S7 TaxID=3143930 RepID=UPI0033963DDA
MNWHLINQENLLEMLDAKPEGLLQVDAEEKLLLHGPNELVREKKKPLWLKFIKQFQDFMIIVLMAAGVIAYIIGDITDTIIILMIVILNAIIGFVQEYRAEKAVEALRNMAAPNATVMRDGNIKIIQAHELVPGDKVLLEAGQIVPADIRLLNVYSLKMQESALTGESHDVEKHTGLLHGEDMPLGDRKNMAFKGTFVTNGRGDGIAVQTGMETEMGKIAKMLVGGDNTTPLQKRMAVFGKKLSFVVLGICILIFATGYLRGEDTLRLLLTTISVAVAAIPEALPAVITISLAFGAQRMVKRQALIRKLPAVETLGSVTYICTDKTGTLTQNKMQVEQSILLKNSSKDDINELLLLNMAISNDVQENEKGNGVGDSTELALFEYAAINKFSKNDLQKKYPRIAEIPFDSERKCMSTLHSYQDRHLLLVKGALESLLERSALQDETFAKDLHQQTEVLAAKGYRVLAHGYRWVDDFLIEAPLNDLEKNLTIIGLTGIMDPPRLEASKAIADCHTAGIQTVMITGDHPETARNIASKIGILTKEESNNKLAVITGKELSKLSWEEFLNRVKKIRVYARVSPEQKLHIVKALQEKEQFVAMTGDGVNDAPALKHADIGIAMGITGTDVSKEAAHMILLDDNFATIAKAVMEGRRIFDNIRKFIKYSITGNTGKVLTLFVGPFLGLPISLLPIHLLWLNLVTDGLPGLALAFEPAEKDIMQRPPRHPKENIFAKGLGVHVVWVGLLMGGLTLGTQAWANHESNPHWQTMVFNVLCLSQMGHVLAIRSESESFFRMGIFSNKPLIGAVILTLLLQIAVTYVPFLQPIFRTEALTLKEFLLVGAVSSLVLFGVEIEKAIFRKRKRAGLKKHNAKL